MVAKGRQPAPRTPVMSSGVGYGLISLWCNSFQERVFWSDKITASLVRAFPPTEGVVFLIMPLPWSAHLCKLLNGKAACCSCHVEVVRGAQIHLLLDIAVGHIWAIKKDLVCAMELAGTTLRGTVLIHEGTCPLIPWLLSSVRSPCFLSKSF